MALFKDSHKHWFRNGYWHVDSTTISLLESKSILAKLLELQTGTKLENFALPTNGQLIARYNMAAGHWINLPEYRHYKILDQTKNVIASMNGLINIEAPKGHRKTCITIVTSREIVTGIAIQRTSRCCFELSWEGLPVLIDWDNGFLWGERPSGSISINGNEVIEISGPSKEELDGGKEFVYKAKINKWTAINIFPTGKWTESILRRFFLDEIVIAEIGHSFSQFSEDKRGQLLLSAICVPLFLATRVSSWANS